MMKYNPVDRFLRLIFMVVAASDGLIGLLALFSPRTLNSLLGIPIPAELFYFRWAGILTSAVAAAYLLAGANPGRHYGIIILSVAVRSVTAIFLFLAVQALQTPQFFFRVALLETVLVLHHAAFAIRFSPRRLARAD